MIILLEFFDEVRRPRFYIRAILLLLLCRVHDFTKYKTARTLIDLFYWPDGFCIDMIVVGLCFILAFQILLIYMSLYKKWVKQSSHEVITGGCDEIFKNNK